MAIFQFLPVSNFHMVSVETKNSKESKGTGTQYQVTKNEANTQKQGSDHGPIK